MEGEGEEEVDWVRVLLMGGGSILGGARGGWGLMWGGVLGPEVTVEVRVDCVLLSPT